MRYLWLVLGVLFPLSNALFACLGYYYSALNLERAVGDTLVFVAVTIILFNIGLRWLFVARRRLTVREALRLREKAIEESGQKESNPELAIVVEDKIDIPAVDAQTRSLLRAAVVIALLLGLPKIWSGLIPSLRLFERVQLWPEIVLLDADEAENHRIAGLGGTSHRAGESESSGPALLPSLVPPSSMTSGSTESSSKAEAQAEDEEKPGYSMTLADLGLALVWAVLTVLAMRNIPGLLEITLLKRLPVDAGSRYAITTIARYFLAFVGATFAFGAIHIGWDTMKWLAAALTFGLAFGLQEIFANFISGLIILLERPVRVGDTVTIGNVEGVVSRIRMRATTVIDWDNREFIVPNKNIITGEITNWTLTDSITRVVFDVGVSYGSDTRKVRALLTKAGMESPYVMKDPAPSVLYRRFGANALEFQLRTYIATRSVWVDTLNDVYTRIDDLFRENGVEMAYPQLDVRLRDSEAELRVRTAD
jgi:potassium efflux system protein